MINLLSPNEKRQLRAARSNTLLIRYNIFLAIVLIFLLLAIGFVYVYLNNTKANAENAIVDNKAKVSDFATVEAQARQFRSNLATAKQILDSEVTYSKVIVNIAQLLPAGTILSTLNLDSATFGTELPLVAQTKSYDRAIALKDSIQNSPLFSNVHFLSITAGETANSDYPFTVTLGVTIKKDAAK